MHCGQMVSLGQHFLEVAYIVNSRVQDLNFAHFLILRLGLDVTGRKISL